MPPDDPDVLAAAARREARWARLASLFWWVQVPIVCGGYWVLSSAPTSEKLILVYLAAVSIIALAATYSAKAKASEAKAASYEHPS